jgi:NAD(P)-dependent dehydrogenase (short-subunit alcohol dehydrogenase family)
VVNNVALVRPARIGAVDLDDLAAVYDLTIRVAVQATQAALPGMIERGWGRIVNITSTVTLGKPERISYGAAKAALEFCSRAWGGELATTGVTVNSVAPGPTETALFRENNPHGSAGEARYLAGIPIGRLGQPHESRRPSPSCSPRTPASSLARRCGWTAAAASGRADMRRSIEELPAVFPDRSCCSVKKIYSEARAMLAEIDAWFSEGFWGIERFGAGAIQHAIASQTCCFRGGL